jgi:hypothetical protein
METASVSDNCSSVGVACAACRSVQNVSPAIPAELPKSDALPSLLMMEPPACRIVL